MKPECYPHHSVRGVCYLLSYLISIRHVWILSVLIKRVAVHRTSASVRSKHSCRNGCLASGITARRFLNTALPYVVLQYAEVNQMMIFKKLKGQTGWSDCFQSSKILSQLYFGLQNFLLHIWFFSSPWRDFCLNPRRSTIMWAGSCAISRERRCQALPKVLPLNCQFLFSFDRQNKIGDIFVRFHIWLRLCWK